LGLQAAKQAKQAEEARIQLQKEKDSKAAAEKEEAANPGAFSKKMSQKQQVSTQNNPVACRVGLL